MRIRQLFELGDEKNLRFFIRSRCHSILQALAQTCTHFPSSSIGERDNQHLCQRHTVVHHHMHNAVDQYTRLPGARRR